MSTTPSPTEFRLSFPLLRGALVGAMFGIALEKSKVFYPTIIRSQMTLDNFVMMKTFLSATATGLVVISMMERAGYITRQNRATALGLGLANGYGGNILGGTILGVGITLSGACPGTVYAQFGAGIPSALLSIAGALFGGMVFGWIHRLVSPRNPQFMKVTRADSMDSLMRTSGLATAVMISFAFSFMVAGLEWAYPWKSELSTFGSAVADAFTFGLSSKAWPPMISGLLIGLLQIPSYLFADTALGTSSSYISILFHVGEALNLKLAEHLPVLKTYNGAKDLYQIGTVAGIALGAKISVMASGMVYPANVNISPAASFFGGMLLIIGARLAGGCTSGHGISGLARLSLSSFITTGFMFAGAMGFGHLIFA